MPADTTRSVPVRRRATRRRQPEGRRQTQQPDADAGSVSVMVAVLGFALLLMVGLVVDGGRQLIAYRRAANDAEQAARAGAEAVNPSGLRAGRYTIDAAAAQAAAGRYLAVAGAGDQIVGSNITVTGNTVAVQVSIRRTTTFLAAVGITGLTATGRGRALLVHGVTSEDR